MSDNIDDFTFPDSPIKRASGAKQGRRAAVPDEDSDGFSSSPLKNRPRTGDILLLEEEPRRARASAPARRTGGWGENDRARTAKSILARAGQGAAKDFSDSDEEPVIPDLEEVEQEDFALKVADAPNVAMNRVATYKELDNDLFKHAAFATLEEIDLRVLTRCLETEAALVEPDDHWSWDTLFTDLAGQMQAEWFPEQEEEDKTSRTAERPYTAFNRFPV